MSHLKPERSQLISFLPSLSPFVRKAKRSFDTFIVCSRKATKKREKGLLPGWKIRRGSVQLGQIVFPDLQHSLRSLDWWSLHNSQLVAIDWCWSEGLRKMFALLSLMTFCLTNPHFHLLWQRIFFNFPFFQAGENENENENENETETRSKHNWQY